MLCVLIIARWYREEGFEKNFKQVKKILRDLNKEIL